MVNQMAVCMFNFLGCHQTAELLCHFAPLQQGMRDHLLRVLLALVLSVSVF
jgi:hypothetical protein